jgi:hypothetical protein
LLLAMNRTDAEITFYFVIIAALANIIIFVGMLLFQRKGVLKLKTVISISLLLVIISIVIIFGGHRTSIEVPPFNPDVKIQSQK